MRDSLNISMFVKEGRSVKVLFPDNSIRLFRISASSIHTAPESGIISPDSPLGHALLGKKLGDEVEYTVGKKILKVKIIGIE